MSILHNHFLIDTCVISELARSKPSPVVKRWMQEQTTESLWLSVITVAEIEKGIAKLEPGQNQQKLTRWFMSVQQWFTGRVLSFDTADAKVFGHICGLSEKAGHKLPMADALLAATALNHQLTLVTRNTKDFERTGAVIFDPWQV